MIKESGQAQSATIKDQIKDVQGDKHIIEGDFLTWTYVQGKKWMKNTLI